MNKKAAVSFIGALVITGGFLVGCDDGTSTLDQQNNQKLQQAQNMMTRTPTPTFNYSVERQNIADRLKLTNDPDLLQWIYCISNGRVIGRFPVRGKVTSGGKRLTSTQRLVNDNTDHTVVMEAPDEMGTYGNSDPYIFWFDPAGNYYQWEGDYFLSTVPYKIDMGYGTIDMNVIDQAEMAKVPKYKQEIAANPKGGK
jgi:hypothetical protein